MRKKKFVAVDSVKKQWDENSINLVYQNLLDVTGNILDEINICGLRSLFNKVPALRYFLRTLELMERELLVQWKISQAHGIQHLFKHQKHWYRKELRDAKGFLAAWNKFCIEIWKTMEKPGTLLHQHPWKSLVLMTLTDKEGWRDFSAQLFSDHGLIILKKICTLFERIYLISPYHHVISFMNLIELAVGYRPELNALGEVSAVSNTTSLPSNIRTMLREVIEKNDWCQMPQKLVDFWRKNSGGIFSLFPAFLLQRTPQGKALLEGSNLMRRVKFKDLTGIDDLQAKLSENIDKFLRRGPAHHILLSSEDEDEKSEIVMSLLLNYADQGLRIIEIPKEHLDLVPQLAATLADKPEKFILFCRDLSFENHPREYSYLKPVLKSSALKPVCNQLIVAFVPGFKPAEKDDTNFAYDCFGLKLSYAGQMLQ